jgi:hypothetical protein
MSAWFASLSWSQAWILVMAVLFAIAVVAVIVDVRRSMRRDRQLLRDNPDCQDWR